jgi:hypothetical protein
MIARVTASTQFPIPTPPRNPHGGIKEAFKLKQVALVIVRHPSTGKYLSVEEQKDKGWWLPAGHVDPNERFAQAAYREALEEAGIGVRLEGVLRVEHRLTAPTKGRLRVVYFGVPIHPEAPLKVRVREVRVAGCGCGCGCGVFYIYWIAVCVCVCVCVFFFFFILMDWVVGRAAGEHARVFACLRVCVRRRPSIRSIMQRCVYTHNHNHTHTHTPLT